MRRAPKLCLAIALTLLLVGTAALAGCARDRGRGAGNGSSAASADAKGSAAVDEFRGPPKVTAETHFASGQLIESRALTPLPNGKMPNAEQVARYRASALEQYERALKLDPKHTASLYRIAVLQSKQKQHAAAVATWQRYVEATGRTPNALVNLGLACELANRPEQAEAAYAEATRRDPSHKAAHVNLGMLLARQGKLQQATNALAAVLPPAATHWHLGVALQAAGREREADQQFRAAASIDPAYAARPTLPAASVRAE